VKALNVFITPESFQPVRRNTALSVVIDVLRASSTIVTAFANGCSRFYPVEEIKDAFKIADELKWRNVVLGGEREGRKVPGFELGNSPREYTRRAVRGKNIVYTTTNGTKALHRCAQAGRAVVLSFLNLGAITRFILNEPSDINIICSGQEGGKSPEDYACGGFLARRLLKQCSDYILNQTAVDLISNSNYANQDVLSFLQTTEHGIFLEKIGFAADVVFCSKVDQFDVVPVYQNGIITV
jgi:2-phosphosulfolactate phosphatase